MYKGHFSLNFKDIYGLLFFKQIIYPNKFLQSLAGSYDYLLTIISKLRKCVGHQQVNLVLKINDKCSNYKNVGFSFVSLV